MDEKNNNYHVRQNIENIEKMREVLETLPPFCKQFFRGISENTSERTRLAYAYDIRVFFEFLHDNNKSLANMDIREFPLSLLEQLTREDIEEYMEYLGYYRKDEKEYTNDERGKKRKLASLRSFYNYYYQAELIEKNPAVLVPLPKLHDKEIIRLDPAEVAILLDQVEDGTGLTKAQKRFHQATKIRDVAMLTLLLGTGIRVSECVGLDLDDVDFRNNGIRIIRKGGFESVVYFGEEVETALQDYLEERHRVIPQSGHENALFLSLQNRRMSVRAVEIWLRNTHLLSQALRR